MDIAIIGIGIRMPEAATLREFQENLAGGRDSVREISVRRKKNTNLSLKETYQLLGYLEDIDLFDPAFFGISRSEARNMSPEQRILMEIAYEAFENAGYNYEHFNNTRTGVYIGDTLLQYYELAREIEPTLYTGNMSSIMAGRVARFFNLRQKAVMVDTTCSSSLVALHQACNDLAAGECDTALVGAVSINLFPRKKSSIDHLGIISPGGKARTFSAGADGTSAGEGAVCLLLKPLEAALADRDIIHAVIKGAAVNQDANLSGSLTAPSSIAQAEVIVEAWEKAGVDPREITYIEAHGTGTKLGDPIEIEGMGQAFARFTDKKHFCAVSAVKSNIGHTDCVAGLAGLVKAVLSLKQQQLFPTLHFNEPNPFIDFANSPVYINDTLRPWALPDSCSRRIAGVSSFGLTGTNCHVVVTEAPARDSSNRPAVKDVYPLLLSAQTQVSLKENMQALLQQLGEQPSLSPEDVSYTLAVGRKHHKYRLVVWGGTAKELELSLQSLSDAALLPSSPEDYPKQVCLFSDWSEAHPELAQAYAVHPVFAEFYQQCAVLAGEQAGNPYFQQFAFQYSLYKLLAHAGVHITTMAGSDVGKIVIAAITAATPLEEAVQAVLQYTPGQDQELEKRTATLLNRFKTERVAFMEMGPVGDISRQINKMPPADAQFKVVPLATGHKDNILTCLATLFQLQVPVNMAALWPYASSNRTELPAYRFDRERCWLGEDLRFDKVKDWCYNFQWVEDALPPDQQIFTGRNLLLAAPAGHPLAQELKQQLMAQQNNIHFLELTTATSESDIIQLLQNAGQLNGIICLSDADNINGALSAQMEQAMSGVYMLFNVLRAASHLFSDKGCSLLLTTVNACQVMPADPANPFQAMHTALLKGIQAEHPWLNIRSLDLDSTVAQYLPVILQELQTATGIGYSAYRNNKRYVAQLGRAETLLPDYEEIEWFPENGTYLVTGGATGIGLALSLSIARQKRSNFIVLGRTTLPHKRLWKNILTSVNEDPAIQERIKALTALEKLDARVEYHAVDISDAAALQTTINSIKSRYQQVDGVLHAAGLAIENIPFDQLTQNNFREALAAKVLGTVLLDEQLQELEPQFFVLCSSLNALVPKKYSTAYTVANAFEDAYALYRSAAGSTYYRAINWPGWDTGRDEPVIQEMPVLGLQPIKVKEGIAAFYYTLQLNSANVAIVPFDPGAFINPYFLTGKATQPLQAVPAKPDQLTPTERKMLNIWQEVLKSDSVSITDDFFEVGGHSLIGIQIVNRIEKELGVTIEFELFFDYYTVKDLSAYIDTLLPQDEQLQEVVFEQIQPLEEQEHYNVSFAQKRLWILNFLVEGNVYNIPTTYVLNGHLNIIALETAFDALIRRHESLRTVLLTIDGTPRQKVLDPGASGFRMKFQDISREANRYELARQLVEKVVDTRFDLFKGPIILAQLIQLETNKFIFSFTLHHIISDGWSSEIIIRELLHVYNACNNGQPVIMPPLNIQYKDYTAWQLQQTKKEVFQEHRQYWLQQFAGEIPVLNLPTDKPRPAVQTFRGETLFFTIDSTVQQQLRELGKQQDATTFMTLFAALNILLYRYAAQQEIVVGATVTERGHYDLENQVGFYVNTLPLRTSVSPADTFISLLEKVKKVVANANKHKDFPLDLLIDELNLERNASRSALFDIMAVYQHVGGQGNELIMEGIEVDDYPLDTDISRFDLTFDFYESDNDITLKLVFNSALYTAHFANNMGTHLQQLLLSCLREPLQAIDDLSLADSAELEKLQAGARMAKLAMTDHTAEDTLVSRWQQSAAAFGERQALWYEGRSWTYQQLHAKSSQLAAHLRETYNIAADDKIAILLDKSDHTVLSILAVLKAGAAYLPLDPAHPAERLQYILRDALPKVIITQSDHLMKLEDYEGNVFAADLELDLLKTGTEDPAGNIAANDLACCIYTSGTTGQPKGSLIEHHSLVNLTNGLNHLLALSAEHPLRMAAIAPVVFDPFGKQVFLALLNGHSLYIVPDDVKRSGTGLWEYYSRHQITLTDGTPSFLQLLVSCFPGGDTPVHYWLIGGEVLPQPLALSLFELYGPEQEPPLLLNEYGLTECAVDNCCYKVTDITQLKEKAILPIGQPLLNNGIFLLDDKLRPVPEGVAGEICIAGAGLGRGYLNRPELTEEKFVEVPALQGLKVFRTGDMGRRLENNELVCLGRKDRQVKIRAHRIELGEIEQLLLKHPEVSEAYVTDRKDAQQEPYLAAYLVLKQPVAQHQMKAHLEKWLPDYMIPAYFIMLDRFPLTINGKIDKAALPDPTRISTPHNAYVAPSTELQKKFCAIWEETLGREQVSIKDNFFDLGGHSLKAVQVVFRLQKELDADINVAAIFRNPTVEKLAAEIENTLLLKNISTLSDRKGLPDMEEVIL